MPAGSSCGTPGIETAAATATRDCVRSPAIALGPRTNESLDNPGSTTNPESEGPAMKVTRGMRRRTAKLARRSAIVNEQALVAGVDIAKKECVVVFVRAADKARLGKLRIPTSAEGVLALANCGQQLLAQHRIQHLVL